MISIIIPVYNAEKYLSECIESIMEQSFNEWELLLVDDGSTDNSGAICESFSAIDKRIKVYHKKNGGSSSARYMGFTKSLGEWVTFIDADDTIDKNYLQNLLNNSQDTNIVNLNMPFNGRISSQQYIELLLRNNTYNGPYNKLFNRELFENRSFAFSKEIRHGEDTLMNLIAALNNQKDVVCSSNTGYNYLIRSSGIVSTFKSSMQYEAHYYNVLKSLFSEKQRKEYMKFLIYKRCRRLYEMVDFGNIEIDYRSSFFQELLSDYKSIAMRLNIMQWVILNLRNHKILRFSLKVIRHLGLKHIDSNTAIIKYKKMRYYEKNG